MGMTTCDNQPPSILLVDIPYVVKGTTRIILYRGLDATELFVAIHAGLAQIAREAIAIADAHKPAFVLVVGPPVGLDEDLHQSGHRAIHTR